MALPANLSENGFSAYLIPFNYLDTQGSGHTPQAQPLCKHALFAPSTSAHELWMGGCGAKADHSPALS